MKEIKPLQTRSAFLNICGLLLVILADYSPGAAGCVLKRKYIFNLFFFFVIIELNFVPLRIES